ncbi:IS1595 family transposase [Spiroplasma endosymbiont of Notiophilus biguttatus]|uniref:IS1595 family transposase n=4 Tax=Spiroplasma endosymbiont of Notiophilus biguttatus TaxID=3066285 RepID=UPI00313AC1D9
MNILDIINKFPNQESCIKFLEEIRLNNKPKCLFCFSEKVNSVLKESRYKCKKCHKSFSVTAQTIFHHTRVPLQKWFILIVLMANAKKSLSSSQASRDLNLRLATVWKMMHKIRKAMANDEIKLLAKILEMDETYVGGKPRKYNDVDNKNNSLRGRGTSKECVVGIIERNGNVKLFHAKNKSIKSEDLMKIVKENVDINNSILFTDEYRGYYKMNKILPHEQVNHKKYFSYNGIHTNTIESFWAILKRGFIGQFHWVSKKWLQSYLNEFCFKYNNRKEKITFKNIIIKLFIKN